MNVSGFRGGRGTGGGGRELRERGGGEGHGQGREGVEGEGGEEGHGQGREGFEGEGGGEGHGRGRGGEEGRDAASVAAFEQERERRARAVAQTYLWKFERIGAGL